MSCWQAMITRSNETYRALKFDLVILACLWDVILHFISSNCYNDNVIKNFEINILDQLFNVYLLRKNTFQKELSLIFSMRTILKPWARSWVENHSKWIKKMHLCLGVGFVSFILKQIKYLVQILYGAIWMASQYLMLCALRKTVCTTSSVSERGDMDSENQCGDPEHRITLCEINSIKTNNIDVYIIKWNPLPLCYLIFIFIQILTNF